MTAVFAESAISAASAQTPNAEAAQAEISALREEMEDLRADYEARIEAMEARLKRAEEAAAIPPGAVAGPTPAPDTAAAAAPIGTPVAVAQIAQQAASVPANTYNPGISVVLNGGFAAYESNPDTARIPGFPLDEEAGLDPEGFSLGESEVVLNANIDHVLYGNLILAFDGEGDVGVEEAYIQTTKLPGGFTAKAGKLFSGIGYLNEKHSHYWDFIDAPLPYRAFLGVQYGDPGVQLRWIAPTDFYLEFGGEWFRGDSFPAAGAAKNGRGTAAGFVQTGGDIGASSSWLAKFSYLRARADERETPLGSLFTGTDSLGIVSGVFKWAPQGNPVRRNLIVNGEYFFGREKGEFDGTAINLNRSGWYAQGVYQFRPRWRIGARYASIGSEGAPIALLGSEIDDLGRSPNATSALLEYDTSEFGRFRLMYTLDDSDALSNNEFFARYTVTFGPHGAHRF
ncbi:MAG: hypothetical protein ABL957_01530 [Parvularculaceae bacterium]